MTGLGELMSMIGCDDDGGINSAMGQFQNFIQYSIYIFYIL